MNGNSGMTKPFYSRNRSKQTYLWMLLAFLVFEYVRIQDSYLPFISIFKFPILLNVALLFVVLGRIKDIPKDGVIYLVLLFVFQMALSVPFAVNNFHAFNATQAMILTVIVFLATVILVSDIDALRKLFRIFVTAVLLVAVWVLKSGGVGPGGFVYDENDACLFLVVGLPFVWYCYKTERSSRLFRFFLLLGIALIIVAIVVTSSRGGFLGAIAVLGMLLLFSLRPFRNIVLVSLLSLFIGSAVIQLAPDNYVDDMKTITDTENSTRNLRFLHWTTAWEIFKDNPIFGVGPQNYPWVSGDYFHLSPYFIEGARGRSGRQSHSLYFTLIPEMGFVGIVLFGSLCFIYFKRTFTIRNFFLKKFKEKGVQNVPYEDFILFNFSSALIVSMIGFLVSGTFISVLYYPLFWNLLGFMLPVWYLFTKNSEKFQRKGFRSAL